MVCIMLKTYHWKDSRFWSSQYPCVPTSRRIYPASSYYLSPVAALCIENSDCNAWSCGPLGCLVWRQRRTFPGHYWGSHYTHFARKPSHPAQLVRDAATPLACRPEANRSPLIASIARRVQLNQDSKPMRVQHLAIVALPITRLHIWHIEPGLVKRGGRTMV